MCSARKQGRPSGEAIVVLANAEQLQLALNRTNWLVGQRWIEVFPAAKTDLALLHGSPTNRVLWLRGVPFGATDVSA